GTASVVSANTPSSIFATTTQYPLPSAVPSTQWSLPNQNLIQNPYPPRQVGQQVGQQMGTWTFGQFPTVKARKPISEDAQRISSSISKWLEKQQVGRSE
ncbi:hypothetical protein OESDEN_19852, partial [Oesophagostomum dentatum]